MANVKLAENCGTVFFRVRLDFSKPCRLYCSVSLRLHNCLVQLNNSVLVGCVLQGFCRCFGSDTVGEGSRKGNIPFKCFPRGNLSEKGVLKLH